MAKNLSGTRVELHKIGSCWLIRVDHFVQVLLVVSLLVVESLVLVGKLLFQVFDASLDLSFGYDTGACFQQSSSIEFLLL